MNFFLLGLFPENVCPKKKYIKCLEFTSHGPITEINYGAIKYYSAILNFCTVLATINSLYLPRGNLVFVGDQVLIALGFKLRQTC